MDITMRHFYSGMPSRANIMLQLRPTPPVVVHLDFEHVVVRLVFQTLLLRLDFDNITVCHDFRNDLISKLGTKCFKRLDAGGRL